MNFMYKPEGFIYNNYSLDTVARNAMVFYEYQGQVVTVYMCKANENIKQIDKMDGEVKKITSAQIKKTNVTVDIWEIESPNKESCFQTYILSGNDYYSIWARISQKDFVEIIENLSY